MRNAVVIFLWLFIGVALGFIVPSGVTKINVINNTLPITINLKGIKEVAKNTLPISTTIETQQASELPINRTKIDEIALYEHATASENVQNERALIYINQKYRKPSLHQFFRLLQNGQDLSRRFYGPPILPEGIIQRLNKPSKLNHSSVHAYFTQLDLLDQPANLGIQFESSKMYDNKFKGAVKSKTNGKEKTITKSKGELGNNKVYNSHSVNSRKNMISKVEHVPGQITTSNYEELIKHFRKLYKESNVVQEKHKDMWKNFRFEIPNANVGYYPKTMLNKVESPKNFEENRIGKNNALRVPENTVDYYKVLRKYNNVQKSMTDQNVTNTNRLSPCDCSRIKKTFLTFDFSTEGYRQKRCKCKRNSKPKPNCRKDKERQESEEMNTILSPSDMNFYKDFLYRSI